MNITWHDHSGKLRKCALKATAMWNTALKQPVFAEGAAVFATRLRVEFGKVDRSLDSSRVAQFSGVRGAGVITLADDIQWSITPWQRFWGTGQEDALAALLHEFGHALGLAHSDRDSDVMSRTLGSTVISDDEAARYRQFLAA